MGGAAGAASAATGGKTGDEDDEGADDAAGSAVCTGAVAIGDSGAAESGVWAQAGVNMVSVIAVASNRWARRVPLSTTTAAALAMLFTSNIPRAGGKLGANPVLILARIANLV
jgi:hypothetical protein